MQKDVLVPSTRIFLQLRGRKILVLGTSSHHVNCLRLKDPTTRDKPEKDGGGSFRVIMAIKADHFVWCYDELIIFNSLFLYL